jgi:hypothetical protein
MNDINCKWDNNDKKIKCYLPITLPTSKVRVKSNGINPKATRQTKISEEDFIEWQISYRDQMGRPIELGEILRLACRYGLILNEEVIKILDEYENYSTFDNNKDKFDIRRENSKEDFYGFKIYFEKTPILRLDLNDGCYIEMVLKHKQKAVGYQVMVYIYIPMKNVTPNLIGQTAIPKQLVIWEPNKDHILGLLKAFLLASNSHRTDITDMCVKICVNNYF